MRKILLAAIAALGLAGCSGGYHHDRVAVGVGVGGPGYYDGHYGAFNDGYWGNDGYFWYSDSNSNWHRDDDHHFRHDGGNGWNQVHGSSGHRDH